MAWCRLRGGSPQRATQRACRSRLVSTLWPRAATIDVVRSRGWTAPSSGCSRPASRSASGELVAAFVRPAASPVIAVGNRIIVLTPESVKRPTISSVGTDDKVLLLGGIYAAARPARDRLRRAGAAQPVGRPRPVSPCSAASPATARSPPTAARAATSSRPSSARWPRRRCWWPSSAWPAAPPVRTAAELVGPPDRRAFLYGGAATAALAAIAGFGGRAAQHARFDVTAARRKVTLPPRRGAAAGGARRRRPRRERAPWATPNANVLPHRHRAVGPADRSGAVAVAHPRHGRPRAHPHLRRRPGPAHDRTLDHAVLRVQRGRRKPGRQRPVPRDPAGRPDPRDRRVGARRPAAAHLRRRLHLRRADGGGAGRPRRDARDRDERRTAAARARLPGANGDPGPLRLRVGLQVDRRHRGHDLRPAPGLLGAGRLVPRNRRSSSSRASTVRTRGTRCRWARPWRSPASRGISTSAWRRSRCRSTTGPGSRPGSRGVPSTDTWRQWVLPWTPDKSGEHRLRVRATRRRRARCRTRSAATRSRPARPACTPSRCARSAERLSAGLAYAWIVDDPIRSAVLEPGRRPAAPRAAVRPAELDRRAARHVRGRRAAVGRPNRQRRRPLRPRPVRSQAPQCGRPVGDRHHAVPARELRAHVLEHGAAAS